jgi:hypothetical protein
MIEGNWCVPNSFQESARFPLLEMNDVYQQIIPIVENGLQDLKDCYSGKFVATSPTTVCLSRPASPLV